LSQSMVYTDIPQVPACQDNVGKFGKKCPHWHHSCATGLPFGEGLKDVGQMVSVFR